MLGQAAGRALRLPFGHPTHGPASLTTPSGSTSSRCLGCPLCRPVSTYWPGVVVLSRTRKSPSSCSSASASRRLSFPWNQGSPRSCSAMATELGGGGARRASSKGSGAQKGPREALAQPRPRPRPRGPLRGRPEGQSRRHRGEFGDTGRTAALTHVKKVSRGATIDRQAGGPGPSPRVPGFVQVLDVDIGGVVKELSACSGGKGGCPVARPHLLHPGCPSAPLYLGRVVEVASACGLPGLLQQAGPQAEGTNRR